MKFLYSFLVCVFAFFRLAGQNDIKVYNTFNCLFSLQTKSGSNPNFTITGTLTNSSGKFAPLASSIQTGDYVLAEYVQGGTRFTGTFEITDVDSIWSASKVTLSVSNVSGRTVANFPNGVHAIVRPNSAGLLPAANGMSEELRTAITNHNASVLDTFPKTAYKKDVLAGTSAATLVCVVASDPDLIASLQARTGSECAFSFDATANRYYFYNGSRSLGYRWIPLDSIPMLYPNYSVVFDMIDSLVFKYPDGSPALTVDDAANAAILHSDNQASIVTVGDTKTTVLANDIELSTRGSGQVKVLGTAAKSGSAEFYEMTGVGTNKVRLKGPDTLAADYIVKLPPENGELATTTDVATVQTDLDIAEAAIVTNSANISALSTKISNVVSLTGRPSQSTTLGSFTGSTIADSVSIKAALQALETAHEATAATVATNTSNISTNTTGISNLVTLSGVAANATNLGTFTGSTIADSRTNKGALQDLESAHEVTAATVATNTSNISTNTTNISTLSTKVSNLQTLSGRANGSTTMGSFTGSTIPDSVTTKAALQALETSLEAGSGDQVYSARLTKHIYFDDLRNVLGSNASTVLGDMAKVQITVTSSGTATHNTVFSSPLSDNWNHPGVVELTTGSGIANTNGGSNMWNGAFALVAATQATGNWTYETMIKTGSILTPNSGNDYTWFVGFAAQALTNYTMNNITGFYIDTNTDAHLRIIIDSSTVRTDIDLNTQTGLPSLSVDTWYKFKITYTHSTRTIAFYVDNVLQYSKVGGFNHVMSPDWSVRRLTDNHSAQRGVFIDYYLLDMAITR